MNTAERNTLWLSYWTPEMESKCKRSIFGLARQRGMTIQDAEDALSFAIEKTLVNVETFDSTIASFYTWFCGYASGYFRYNKRESLAGDYEKSKLREVILAEHAARYKGRVAKVHRAPPKEIRLREGVLPKNDTEKAVYELIQVESRPNVLLRQIRRLGIDLNRAYASGEFERRFGFAEVVYAV